MIDSEDTPSDGGEGGGGSLADAIAAHLELKKEHGADPEAVEREQADALGGVERQIDRSDDLHPEPEPEREPEPAPEPVATADPEPELPSDPAPVPQPEPEREPESEAPPPAPPAPGEITGTIEFEWEKEEQPAEDANSDEPIEQDPLEDTPDFFEETPEHDKLWFDESPPRKFDF